MQDFEIQQILWLWTGTSGSFCECDNKPSGYAECKEVFDKLRKY
jgi:hypothetical protein